jgi:hypothetical protein
MSHDILAVYYRGKMVKGEVHLRTRHEGPEGEYSIALLFL